MTNLEKTVKRRTSATRFEKSQRRQVVISLEPTALIGVRLEGTRQTYRVDAEVLYEFAVRMHVAAVERRTKELIKAGKAKRSAVAQARKELAGRLR